MIDIEVCSAPGPWLDDVEPLFLKLYAHMASHGLLLPLALGGERNWRKGVELTLGRLGVVVLARDGSRAVGFAQGLVRVTPDYLGAQKVGYVGHVFVDEDVRRRGALKLMFPVLQEWFRSKGVSSLELQVLWRNTGAIEAWAAMGFERELLQMRKLI